MLFAAHDSAKIDKSDNTLLQRDDAVLDTATEFLKFQLWDKDVYETLEHVAPQNEQSAGWAKVYEDQIKRHNWQLRFITKRSK